MGLQFRVLPSSREGELIPSATAARICAASARPLFSTHLRNSTFYVFGARVSSEDILDLAERHVQLVKEYNELRSKITKIRVISS